MQLFFRGQHTNLLRQRTTLTTLHVLHLTFFVIFIAGGVGCGSFCAFQCGHFLLSLTLFFLTTALAFGALLTALLLLFALCLGGFFRLRLIGNRGSGLLRIATVAALLVTHFTCFTAFAVIARFAIFTRLTIITIAVITAFTALFAFTTFWTIATFTALTTVFTTGTLTTLTTTILATVFTVAFGLRRFNHRFGFDNRLFFTGKQRFQTTKQTAQQTRFGSGWCSLFGCCCRNGGLSSNGFFSRWWCIGGQRERGQSRLFRAFALHRRIFQRLSHLFFVQFRQQVAQGWCFFTLTYAQHRVVWGLHLIVRHDDRFHATLTFLDRAHRFTFFVQQVRSHLNWHDSVNFFGVFFQRFFFDQTKNGKRQRFVITDGAGAVTARANVMAGFTQ